MGHSSVISSSKNWHTIVLVLIISCSFHVTLSASVDGETTESSIVESEGSNGGSQSNQNQRVTPGLCNINQTASDIQTEQQNEDSTLDSRHRYIIVSPVQDATEERSSLYHFSLYGLTRNDDILNATVFTPFSKTTASQPLNVTISIRVIRRNVTQREVEFTNVHQPITTETNFCLQGTLTQVVQQLLETETLNLTFDVTTSCQSSSLETTGCSVDHLGRPFLVIHYRKAESSNLEQRVIPDLCNFIPTYYAIQKEELAKNTTTDSRRIWRFSVPFTVDRVETSTIYYFSLDFLKPNDTILNATIFDPFIIATSGNLSQTDSPTLNVTISVRKTEENGTQSQVQLTNVYHLASGKTEFCHQMILTEVLPPLLKADGSNMTLDVRISCQVPSGSAESCSVVHPEPGLPLFAVYHQKSMSDQGQTTQPPNSEPGESTRGPQTHENQTVTPGLCTFNETALAIHNWLVSENTSSDSSIKWIFAPPIQDSSESPTLYHFSLYLLTMNDTILNATVYTPFTVTTSEDLEQPDSPPLNVTISVTMTGANGTNSQVQFTKVYSPTTATTEFCHKATLTQMVQQLLETDRRSVTVDVRTSCQFQSSAAQGTGCSVDHPEGSFLAINIRTSSETFPWSNLGKK